MSEDADPNKGQNPEPVSYTDSLPAPSERYGNLIFWYPEDLAIQDRESLFAELNEAAAGNNQTLVITDVKYKWHELRVYYDELGAPVKDLDYDDIIEDWHERNPVSG